ncbi:VIT domain-containing protein [Polyangium mundeleinium]|uniref:VIT domain-containing protein n=1 Tax=Polyangium mundeleinium TaxID=2995306 RepID=A0ABT5EK07_9BACT|nr:VIT domain-containing protein [Polyangium mundeleinium]MDC0742172.1 VIT domain-containing protein [Polyangium mundeleinium]
MSDERREEQDVTSTPTGEATATAGEGAVRPEEPTAGPEESASASKSGDETASAGGSGSGDDRGRGGGDGSGGGSDNDDDDDDDDDDAPAAAAPEPPRANERRIVVVTRGEKLDTAEWLPVSDPRAQEQIRRTPPPPLPPQGGSIPPALFAIVSSIVVILVTVVLLRGQGERKPSQPLVPTVADLQAVHASVTAAGAPVHKTRRLSEGDVVKTDTDGRARLRLDDGTGLVLDRSTSLRITQKGVALEHGRIFVQGALGARTEIELGEATGIVSGANTGIERSRERPASAKLYAATEEITVRAGGAEKTVRAGETATVDGSKVEIAPERGYDDWTGGMAAPWGAKGAPRRAVGELWGRPDKPGDAGSPLTIRAHDVEATVARELAETEVRTTFFNAGSTSVTGDYRLAIPPGAIVARFASVRGGNTNEGHIALATRDARGNSGSGGEVLEWAGEGWVRATIPSISPGATVQVIVRYVEWLSPRPKGDGNWVVQYRYPMVSDAAPPLIGEFSAKIDATQSSPKSIGAGLGARVTGSTVEVRRPDYRPTADLVVDVAIEPSSSPARLFVAPPFEGDEDDPASTILVRTEVPEARAEDGVTLALVLDVSSSVEPALLDAERALVDAVLSGLGARDKVVVLAADQTVHPLGPAAIGPVDDARRKAIREALGQISTGGATDLGRALEAGADALPADAPAGMVIYVGDGWPTVGDPTVDRIQARLARRQGGAPRLGAVGVGPLVNRFALASLVRGSGPLLEIADTTDAARVATELISEALQPAVAGVEVVFGTEVDRIYPRSARAITAGETVFAVGRVRGDPPRSITLRYRDARGVHEEKRPVVVERALREQDVARRWAAARVEEIALKGKGREAATDVALRAGLLTPWTGFVIGGPRVYAPSLLQTRILDLSAGPESGFSAAFATPRAAAGTLMNVPQETESAEDKDDEAAYKAAVAEAAARLLDEAGPSVRACRDSRAALRPELSGKLDVNFSIDGEGRAEKVRVKGVAGADDEALHRCVEVVVRAMIFPASGLNVSIEVTRTLGLPPPRATLRGRKCSPTSFLPMPLRRGVWRERLERSQADVVYVEAKQSCELPTWTDRRALLELILVNEPNGLARVGVAGRLELLGESDAAALLRREAIRRAQSPEELYAIKRELVGSERYPVGTFRKQYRAADGDKGRLAVVRRFLGIAPHDARLRRRLFALLEALDMKAELSEEIRRARRDPFADAGLLADAASALLRIGDEAEARRTFGELSERAPRDPWARAFLGDRLRNEGFFDDASLAYAVLEELVPEEPAAVIRLALAHAGAGRLDIAHRMLARVAQTGGRAGDETLGRLAGYLAHVLLAEGRGRQGLSESDTDRLARASLELPYPNAAVVALVRAPAGALALDVKLLRDKTEDPLGPDVAAAGVGLYALRFGLAEKSPISLRLARPEELAPARATKVRVDALVPDGEGKPPKLVSIDVELPPTGKPVTLRWMGSAFTPG